MDLVAKKTGRSRFSRWKFNSNKAELYNMFTEHIATLRPVNQAINKPYHGLYKS